ncbi:MAG: putative aliphatic sulfonates transport permease protein SsuC [Devosia sp.]|jgi:sulfonate transport system permease protein|nr:putative aliphatic sulfonates transport permease protein SsuC [Devosia sp.]
MSKFYPLSGFIVILLAWSAVSVTGTVNAFLLPPPWRVWSAFVSLIDSGKLFDHILISMSRVGIGYLFAVLLAFSLTLVMVTLRPLAVVLEGPLEFLRQIPPLALVPLTMLWLGIGETQKVGIIMLACFFPIFLGVRGGFSQVDPKLIEVGRAARFSRLELLWRIVLPAALPSAVIGLRVGLGYGWRALVGAELIASSAGLGYMILDAQDLARTDIVLVGVLTIGVIGILVDTGLKLLLRSIAPWMRNEVELGNA